MTTTSAATHTHAQAAARLRAAVTRLNRALRQQNVGDLSLSEWSALATVEGERRMRIGDLADHEHVSAPTATRVVASLERRGLLTRKPDPADRRSALVALTPAGSAALRQVRRVRTEALARRLAELDAADVDRVLDALPVLERLARED